MADFTLRDGLRAFWRGFLLGAFAGAAYQLVKNPGTCSCCGCVLAILALIVVAVVVVAVIQWWTWISFIILLVVAARLVAEHLSRRSRSNAADGDR